MSSNSKTNENNFPIIQIVLMFFIYLFTFVLGNRMLGENLAVVLRWWGGVLITGFAFYPLTYVLFGKFHDGGHIVSKALGLAVAGWVVWTLSTFHILKFTNVAVVATVAVCAVLNYVLYYLYCKKNNKPYFEGFSNQKLFYILLLEALFLLVFIGACYIKSFRVTITKDTEKYMDFGFLASVMNTDYLPAKDMWYSGGNINYYYFGIYIAGFIGKLTGLHAGFAYNLDLMMIAALGSMQVYSLVMELLLHAVKEHDVRKLKADPDADETSVGFSHVVANIGGALAGAAVFAAGNMHYVIYGKIIPWVQEILGLEVTFYWFPNSTRFIKDGEGEAAGTLIHEFPSYSFVLGDLHAHVTNIPFVLVIISVLFVFLLNRNERMEKARLQGIFEKVDYKKEALNPCILMATFLIGIFRMTNTWDFMIYFVVSGAVILFSNAIITGFKKEALIMTAVHAAEFVLISTIVALPFIIHFDSMTSGIGVCFNHSSPYELAVLWALPISVCIGLFVIAITAYKLAVKNVKVTKPKKGDVIKEQAIDPTVIYNKDKSVNHLFSFIHKLQLTDLFVLTIAACAMGLILMCEIVYVRDIYGANFARTNTMFKLTYQAFMMFGIVMGYGLIRLIAYAETKTQRILSIIAVVFLVWTFGYLGRSISSYTGDISKPENYTLTLNSYEKIFQDEGEDLAATVEWVNENLPKDAVILQMNSTSYKPFARISAFTGRPTVIGWAYHEWLWRNHGTLQYPPEVQERVADVLKIYTSTDRDEVMALIEKYDIDYIYLGETETMNGMAFTNSPAEDSRDRYVYYKKDYNYFEKINTNYELLKSLGDIVYDGHTEGLGYSTYIIKVDRFVG